MNITHFNDCAIDSCSGYKKPLTPENECLAVTLALAIASPLRRRRTRRPGLLFDATVSGDRDLKPYLPHASSCQQDGEAAAHRQSHVVDSRPELIPGPFVVSLHSTHASHWSNHRATLVRTDNQSTARWSVGKDRGSAIHVSQRVSFDCITYHIRIHCIT
ncbi:MAG: hypothetical protein ACI9WU_004447 [Myxococcota bacterium]|jgi:hypothetical protein